MRSSFILTKSPVSPSNSELSALSNCVSGLRNLNSVLVELNYSKNDKNKYFEILEIFSQSFILSALVKSSSTLASLPSQSFSKIFKYSSATKTRVCFNNKLEIKVRETGTRLAIMALVLSGDMVNEPEDPDKVLLEWLGPSQKGTSCDSKNKDQLRFHHQ